MKKPLPLLTSTAYLPPAHWLTGALSAGEWRVEAHENYQKGGWRNRCLIAGPNGVQILSIPLEKGKHQKKPIREVLISYRDDWWREHEQSIRTAYGRSPYYEYYAEELFAVARARPATLWELNQHLLVKVTELLRWPVSPTPTVDFVAPQAAGYLRAEDLPAGLPDYPQVFTDRHGYLSGLSVLDALFCLGPRLITAQT
jgi:hypothetical protein